MPTLNREGLAKAVAKETGLPLADVNDVLSSIQENIINTVADGDNVKLMGFLAIEPTERGPRRYKSPRTGEDVTIGPSRGIRLRPMKHFRDRVAETLNVSN